MKECEKEAALKLPKPILSENLFQDGTVVASAYESDARNDTFCKKGRRPTTTQRDSRMLNKHFLEISLYVGKIARTSTIKFWTTMN